MQAIEEVRVQCSVCEVVTELEGDGLDPQFCSRHRPEGKRNSRWSCGSCAECGEEIQLARSVPTYGPVLCGECHRMKQEEEGARRVAAEKVKQEQDREIPCKLCGDPTIFSGTKRCNNCWEIEGRFNVFKIQQMSKTPEGSAFLLQTLQSIREHLKPV